jgi:uncharacterized membrane protein YhiD involved in acid resistance
MWRKLLTISILFIALPAGSQEFPGVYLPNSAVEGAGWQGLLDFVFLANIFLTLSVAALLGAVLAFHPKHTEVSRSSEGMDSPKVFVLFPVIGAVVGMMVVKYGLVVGFVLFGLGGIVRFRTAFRSPNLTGRIILVTLIGLAAGLHLLNVAILATLFAFVLFYFLDVSTKYRIVVTELPREHLAEAIMAYRAVLDKQDCRVVYERANCRKSRVTFGVKCKQNATFERLNEGFKSEVDDSLAGIVSWRVA